MLLRTSCCRLHYFAKAFNPTKTTLVDTVSRSELHCRSVISAVCCDTSSCVLHCLTSYLAAQPVRQGVRLIWVLNLCASWQGVCQN
jgi:hypothetical protein